MPDVAAIKVKLEERLSELRRRQAHIAADLSETPDRDWEEQAIDIEDDEPLEAQGALIAREVFSVERALERLQDGTYGICAHCGKEIAQARLEVSPEASSCVDCARGLE